MRQKLLLFLLVLSGCFGSLHADESQYENKKITHIVIEAENTPQKAVFKQETVGNKMRTKVGDSFQQSTFDLDLKNLSKEYDRVDPTITADQHGVSITLKVWLRPLITSITFSGNSHYKEKKLFKELGVQPYSLFNRNAFNRGFHNLKAFLHKKGYFETDIDYTITNNKENNEVAINISIQEGRSGRIQYVNFDGATSQEVAELKSLMRTKKYNPMISWITQSGIYHEDQVDYDQTQILDFFRNHGYADTRVTVDVIDTEDRGRIGIAVHIDKGGLFKVKDVTFEGNSYVDNEVIQEQITITEGSPYSPKEIQDTVTAITDYYGKKGYIDVAVTYEPHFIKEADAYSLNFHINEGSSYKVGLIKIIGNKQTIPKVILRETHLEPGKTFNTKMLEATRKRLENVGLYKHVNIYPSTASSTKSIQAPIRDVNIQVQETTTGGIGANAGFSTVDTVYGGLELSEKNFNLLGIFELPSKGISALRGGGEYFSLKSSLGLKLTDYSLNWMKPYFLDTGWTIGCNVNRNISRVQSDSYNLKTFTTTFNTYYQINAFVDYNTFYRLRDTQMNVKAGALTPALERQMKNNGVISSLGVGLQYETRNNPYRPTQGISSTLNCEYAGIGGQFYYVNMGYNNTFYVPVGPFVLKTRADFNFIKPFGRTTADTVPSTERFFLATDISQVRGFKPFAIGPQIDNPVKDNGVLHLNEPKGGNSQVLLSQEIMYPLVPRFLDIFAFIDAGSLYEESFKVQNFKVSTGVGIRINANPNIPLMVGFGWPVNVKRWTNDKAENRRAQSQNVFFSLTGRF